MDGSCSILHQSHGYLVPLGGDAQRDFFLELAAGTPSGLCKHLNGHPPTKPAGV